MTNVQRVPNEIRPIIRRSQMPQIERDMYGEVMVHLSKHGIKCAAGLIDPRKLYYHQDVNFDRARRIPDEAMLQPVLISSDFGIFDGNHRSYAHVVKELLVPFIRLNCSFMRGLPILNSFPKSKHARAA